MKIFILIALFMTQNIANAQLGQASTEKKTFSRTTRVSILINAEGAQIWSLLTTAENYPKWNSTVTSITGKIAEKEKIKLKSTLDPSRTFKLKVKEMVPSSKMVWGDAMGNRVYTLTKTDNGVLFSMTEKIGGLMFPLFANKIPSFDASFEQFAKDLKTAAESL